MPIAKTSFQYKALQTAAKVFFAVTAVDLAIVLYNIYVISTLKSEDTITIYYPSWFVSLLKAINVFAYCLYLLAALFDVLWYYKRYKQAAKAANDEGRKVKFQPIIMAILLVVPIINLWVAYVALNEMWDDRSQHSEVYTQGRALIKKMIVLGLITSISLWCVRLLSYLLPAGIINIARANVLVSAPLSICMLYFIATKIQVTKIIEEAAIQEAGSSNFLSELEGVKENE